MAVQKLSFDTEADLNAFVGILQMRGIHGRRSKKTKKVRFESDKTFVIATDMGDSMTKRKEYEVNEQCMLPSGKVVLICGGLEIKTPEDQKKLVGKEAAKLVENGMIVGIGTGTTAKYFIQELGRRMREEGLKIKAGVVTSDESEELCKEQRIPLKDVDDVDHIDLAVDGADEFDKDLNLIKGGGGAHVREKAVDYKAKKFIVIVDASKKKTHLGDFPLPVEVEKDEQVVKRVTVALKNLGANPITLRNIKGTKWPYITDNGNYILDAKFMYIKPARMEELIQKISGVVENGVGIFTGDHVSAVWVGTDDGVEIYTK